MSKLAEAKALLQERGRSIGVLENSATGCVCPLGALALAYYGEAQPFAEDKDEDGGRESLAYEPVLPEHRADIAVLANEIRKVYPQNIPDAHVIFQFNDSVAQSDQAVLNLFDAAIAA